MLLLRQRFQVILRDFIFRLLQHHIDDIKCSRIYGHEVGVRPEHTFHDLVVSWHLLQDRILSSIGELINMLSIFEEIGYLKFHQASIGKALSDLFDTQALWYRHTNRIRLTIEQLINNLADGHIRSQLIIYSRLQMGVQAFDTRPHTECYRVADQPFRLQILTNLSSCIIRSNYKGNRFSMGIGADGLL